jgi:PAS domain-containing protein
MLGYSVEEYVGRNVIEFNVDRELIGDILKRLIAGETIIDRVAQMRSKDGSVRNVLINADVLRGDDGVFLHSRWFLTDVTAQQRAETAARRLAAIVESSEDAIVSKDLNSVVTSWNNAAERMFGYSASEMIGRSITILIPPTANEEPEILDRIRRGIRVEHF